MRGTQGIKIIIDEIEITYYVKGNCIEDDVRGGLLADRPTFFLRMSLYPLVDSYNTDKNADDTLFFPRQQPAATRNKHGL